MTPQQIPCSPREQRWVLATAILGSSLAFIEGTAVNLALPSLQADLVVSSTDIQWVATSYLLVLGSLMLVGGALGDRYGLRRTFIAGTLLFAVGALLCALASSLAVLIAARSVQGLGGALLVPNSLALVSSHFAEDERGQAIGTWAGASALVTALGPLVGGWLVDAFGWPAVFFFVAPLGGLTAVVAWLRLPHPPKAATGRRPPPVEAGPQMPQMPQMPLTAQMAPMGRLDYAGGALLAGALALAVYATAEPGAVAGRAVTLLVAFGAGALFLWREARAASPIMPLALFRSRAFSGTNLMTLLLYAALSALVYFLPFNLIQVQGYSALEAGAAFLPFTLVMGLGSRFAGQALKTRPARLVLTVGPLLTALGFVALSMPGANASFATGFLPGIGLIAIGMTISVAPLTTVVMSAVPGDHAGVAAGINNTVSRLAGVLAVAALTVVAVGVFRAALDRELGVRTVPAAVRTDVSSHADQLAQLSVPRDLPSAVATDVRNAVAGAYVQAFRVLMLVCAVLAAASAGVAWIALAPARAEHLPPPRQASEF